MIKVGSFFGQRISLKLLLLTILFSTIITICITVLQLYIDYKNGINSINEQFDLVVESHSNSLVESIWAYDEEQISLQLKDIVSLPDILFTSIKLTNGEHYKYGEVENGNTVEKKFKLFYHSDIKDVYMGDLTVIADLSKLYSELKNKILILLLSQGLKTFFVSLFILYIFQLLITRHIQSILAYTNSLTFNKKNKSLVLNKKIFKNQHDELDTLADSINKMQKEIYNSYMEAKKTETELKEQKEFLAYQAHHDALTGLPNRALLYDRLEQFIKESKRHKNKFAVLFIDLDHFKEINDSLGHNTGDEVLKMIASRLRKVLRSEDTVVRLGGDEFTVILNELAQAQEASIVADKILEILSKQIEYKENTLYISSSIGISIYPDDGQDSQSLLQFADSAMYKAKYEGRNNYQYYSSEMTELALERVVMETSLRAGIENEEFIVYYQPQVDGVTGKLVGMEALVRWQHPTMGLVSPVKFIALAESTGLIIKLDRYIMKTAMTQICQWKKDGLDTGTLAMNLSVKQLKQEDFIDTLISLLKETGCKPQHIVLEITEGQVMTNPEEAIKQLEKISNLGVKLAVDDFGTGYSSLAYLKRLPIDKLKIDRAFVRGLPDDEEDSGISRAVIALAKSLNLKIIAEGVETQEQKDFLVENGCRNIQGYYYSKPVPANEFEKILRNGLNHQP